MSKEKYTFEKKVTNGDISLRFVFVGLRESFDYNHFNNMIDNFFDKFLYIRNMEENVEVIRTLFRDFDETNLYVEIISSDYRETVRYSNKKLDIYNLEHYINFNKLENIFSVKYVLGRGIDFSFSDNKVSIIKDMTLNRYIKLVDNMMEKLYRLSRMECRSLNTDHIKLCEAYNLFYGCNPDFTDKNILINMHNMVYILKQFDVLIGDKYHFRYYYDKDMPFSETLEDYVRYLSPFGILDIDDNNSKLSNSIKKRILSVKKCFNNNIDDIDYLSLFSRILYVKNELEYDDTEKISLFTKYPSDEIDNNLKLVRKINSRLNK